MSLCQVDGTASSADYVADEKEKKGDDDSGEEDGEEDGDGEAKDKKKRAKEREETENKQSALVQKLHTVRDFCCVLYLVLMSYECAQSALCAQPPLPPLTLSLSLASL